jgi:hypothetical protein
MAPPQPIVVLEPLPWARSTVMSFALNELVNGGLLEPNVEGAPPAWIVSPASDREPNPPYGYVVSFVRLHERGFTTLASRFMRGLCYHYGVELRNFAPNANPSLSEEEGEEESDGGWAPSRGGIPRPRYHGPRRRLWSWRLWRAWRHPPPGY